MKPQRQDRQFHRLVLDEGGEIKLSSMRGSARLRAMTVEKQFADLVGFLQEAVPEECVAWVQSLRLHWVRNPEVNAVAIHCASISYIGLYMGVVRQLWDVYVALAAHPLHFKDADGALAMGPEEAAVQWSRTVNNLVRGEPPMRNVRATLSVFARTASTRMKIASALYSASLNFLLMHEIHHFWCGHIFAIDSIRRRGMSARSNRSQAMLDPHLRRTLEYQADYYAARRIFEAFAQQEGLDRAGFLHVWLTAVSVLFMVFDPIPQPTVIESAEHPHPHSRLMNVAVVTYNSAFELFGMDESDVDSVIHHWVDDMVQMEVFGKNVQPPFMNVLVDRTAYDKEHACFLHTVRSSVREFERHRQEMMRHFRESSTRES